MSCLIHITESLDGRFSKSRDIAVHNSALRPKFAPSVAVLLRLLFCLLLRHVIAIFLMGVGRGRERPGTLTYMTRKGQEEGSPSLPPSCRRRRARNSFSAAPVRSRHLSHIRTGSGKHGESLLRDSEHVQGIYSRGGRSRMSLCSFPSEFPDPLPFPELCRF